MNLLTTAPFFEINLLMGKKSLNSKSSIFKPLDKIMMIMINKLKLYVWKITAARVVHSRYCTCSAGFSLKVLVLFLSGPVSIYTKDHFHGHLYYCGSLTWTQTNHKDAIFPGRFVRLISVLHSKWMKLRWSLDILWCVLWLHGMTNSETTLLQCLPMVLIRKLCGSLPWF